MGADGQILFDSLLKNQEPIEEGALRVHHISEAMLKDAPTFTQMWPGFSAILNSVPYVFTYNVPFDLERLKYTAKREGIKWTKRIDEQPWCCLMALYAEHWGEKSWSSYRWQRLEMALLQQHIEHQGFHRALSDAQAAYKLLCRLASKYGPLAVKTEQRQVEQA